MARHKSGIKADEVGAGGLGERDDPAVRASDQEHENAELDRQQDRAKARTC